MRIYKWEYEKELLPLFHGWQCWNPIQSVYVINVHHRKWQTHSQVPILFHNFFSLSLLNSYIIFF